MEIDIIWRLKSVNFDELKQGLDKNSLDIIGNAHCKLCVLSHGFTCIKRNICRADTHNEVYVNVTVDTVQERRKKKLDNINDLNN